MLDGQTQSRIGLSPHLRIINIASAFCGPLEPSHLVVFALNAAIPHPIKDNSLLDRQGRSPYKPNLMIWPRRDRVQDCFPRFIGEDLTLVKK
jgi:hypothetical protein